MSWTLRVNFFRFFVQYYYEHKNCRMKITFLSLVQNIFFKKILKNSYESFVTRPFEWPRKKTFLTWGIFDPLNRLGPLVATELEQIQSNFRPFFTVYPSFSLRNYYWWFWDHLKWRKRRSINISVNKLIMRTCISNTEYDILKRSCRAG